MNDPRRRLVFVVVLLALIAGPLVFAISGVRFWPEWHAVNEPLHAALEGLGGATAIILAILFLQRTRNEYGGMLVPLAFGFVSMGLLDLFHAAATPSHGFVLLHSISSLAGGFWFALVWIPTPTRTVQNRVRRWAPWIIFGGATIFGAWILRAGDPWPTVTAQGTFTRAAVAINLLAALLFLIAAGRLLTAYVRGGGFEMYLLSCTSGLFGLANAMFPFSTLWGGSWWMWHVLRVSAYLLALGFSLRQYRRTVSDLSLELTQHAEDKARLFAAEARYRTLFEQSPDGVIVIDPFTQLPIEFNERAHTQLGYTREEFARLQIRDYEAVETPGDTGERIERLMAGAREDFETVHRTKSGASRNVLVTTQKIMLGHRPALHCIFRDVTEAKQAERSLRAADDQLREQAALVTLGQMAAVVAHEVKNPLAGVRGAIQVIGRRLPAQSKEAAIIEEAVARLDALDELMRDMLLFARPPQASPTPVDLTELAQETAELVGQDPSARDVRFVVEGSKSVVMVDAKLLRIVILNLLVNAVQAIDRKGTVRLSVAATPHGCQLAVADSGPGIPPEIRERVFAPFFTTKARGTGLGLPTAKRLVDAHHGRISLACPVDGGTVVTIELPRDTVVRTSGDTATRH